MIYASQPVDEFREGMLYHGFRLKEKRFIPEVNAQGLYFLHEQSGARLMKIAADDPNKLFNIAFMTPPSNSTGVPHIMEHSVLNGSRNFPVKSPFTVLAQGSLNTFLNAMTGYEFTTYPVSSMNIKDYFNLMHVYLDAVLFPAIYDDPRIFLQEGWHYELDDPDAEIFYRGIVYNEMKGYYSSPSSEMTYQVNKALFPDNSYAYCPGGYPEVLIDLSYEDFLDFHRIHYHPSNSFITLYGNADLNQELSFIDKNYLSQFQASDARIIFHKQDGFQAMKEVHKPYSVAEGSPERDNTYLSLNFVAGEGTDGGLRMALQVLVDALVNHQSAPVRMALQEAGLGKNVRGGLTEGLQNVVSIQLENANVEDKDRFRDIVFQVMQQVAQKGFEKEMLEGIISRREFALREGNTSNKGMMYMMNSYLYWLFGDDPFSGLQFESSLAYVKQALDTPLLENLMKQHLMDNTHSVFMVLYPQPGREAVLAAKERQRLADYKKSLDAEQIQALVKQTKDLRAYQMRQDTPEDLATIPMLALQDISPEIQWYALQEKKLQNVPVLHYEVFTNDILYSQLFFDLRVLPRELIPYARLLSAIFRQMGTTEKTFGQLDNALNINTGGFATTLQVFRQNQSEDDILPVFVAGGKVTLEKAEVYYSLLQEMILQLNLQDKERLKTLLTRHQASTRSMIENDGVNVALLRLNSYFSVKGVFEEMVNGYSYYQFITGLADHFDEQYEQIVGNLQKTASLLFSSDNLKVQLTVDKKGFEAGKNALSKFINSLPRRQVLLQAWEIQPAAANEALLSASKVQYVVQGFDFKKLGYQYDGKMRVLNQILSRVYLQNVIREIGGAYGGWAVVEPSGIFNFVSYRDPNLKETLDNYQAGLSYLKSFNADEKDMTRYIIGTIAGLDRPRTVSAQGSLAMFYYMEGISEKQLRDERMAVLSTTAEDIRNLSDMVGKVLSRNVYCVYGNEEKIRQNEGLFSSMLNVP